MRSPFHLLYTTLICLGIVSYSAAQEVTLPNGGFEFWENVGQAKEEPTSWNSNKSGGGLASSGPQTCFRESSNPHGGTYCLKLETKTFFGQAVNGTATTGKIEAPTVNPNDGYIRTIWLDSEFSTPFTGRPDSLVGYYRYKSVSGDKGLIRVFLHGSYDFSEPDQGGSAAELVGEASFTTPANDVNGWTRFAVPFTYTKNITPSFVLIIATSGADQSTANAGSILWLDDLDLADCNTYKSSIEKACRSYTWAADGNTYTESGTYNSFIPNSQGCDSVISLHLDISKVSTLVDHNPDKLESQAIGATYQWLDCADGHKVLPGETGKSISVSGDYSYAVELTHNGCKDTSDCYSSATYGIDESSRGLVSIYPNPTTGLLNLVWPTPQETLSVRVISATGQVVQAGSYQNTDAIQLQLPAAAGLYWIEVESGTGEVERLKVVNR